ncbi:hypothetical protein LCGC14_1012370, partial [marine sediment metagenome]
SISIRILTVGVVDIYLIWFKLEILKY